MRGALGGRPRLARRREDGAVRPGAGMKTSGGYGASGVGWLSMVVFWGLAIVGLVLVVWRSWNAAQSGPGARA